MRVARNRSESGDIVSSRFHHQLLSRFHLPTSVIGVAEFVAQASEAARRAPLRVPRKLRFELRRITAFTPPASPTDAADDRSGGFSPASPRATDCGVPSPS